MNDAIGHSLNPTLLRMTSPKQLEDLFWECLVPDPPPATFWQDRFPHPPEPPATSPMLAELAWCWSIIAGNVAVDSLPPWLLQTRPLPTCKLPLRSMLKHCGHSAMAILPLAGQGGHEPRLARLYGIKGNLDGMTHGQTLVDEKRFTDQHSWYLHVPSDTDQPIDGNSWQLAAELVKAAIEPELKDLRQPLGTSWIVSGLCCGEGKITTVVMANKSALMRLHCGKSRKWLVPDGNVPELKRADDAKNTDVFGVSFLADAITYILGQGVQELPQVTFPSAVDTLHQLVGGSIGPQLSVPLMLNPKKLVLCHSDQTTEQAQLIKLFFNRRKEIAITVDLLQIPSNRLPLCEVTLRQNFSQASPTTSLVNITGGNRLMGQAALLAAKSQGMQIVYRDVDAPHNELEVIDFVHKPIDLIKNGKTTGNSCPCPRRFNWDALFAREKPQSQKLPRDEIAEIEEKYLSDTAKGDDA